MWLLAGSTTEGASDVSPFHLFSLCLLHVPLLCWVGLFCLCWLRMYPDDRQCSIARSAVSKKKRISEHVGPFQQGRALPRPWSNSLRHYCEHPWSHCISFLLIHFEICCPNWSISFPMSNSFSLICLIICIRIVHAVARLLS